MPYRLQPLPALFQQKSMLKLLCVMTALLLITYGAVAQASSRLTIAYAGSMGVVMDRYINPIFTREHRVKIDGIGQGAWALARLLASGRIQADVFISITPGPIRWLIDQGVVTKGVPVASTQMVVAYSPQSRFATQFKQAIKGKYLWFKVLERKGFRFGRTDPATDPQGRNVIFTFQLASLFYHQPKLEQKILGSLRNPQQIFSEPSLLSRLESGQVDATVSYLSAVRSRRLPYVKLPDEINLGNPRDTKRWYSHAGFYLRSENGQPLQVKPQPLVFYAAIMNHSHHLHLAQAYINFLRSPRAQNLFQAFGYALPKGPPLS